MNLLESKMGTVAQMADDLELAAKDAGLDYSFDTRKLKVTVNGKPYSFDLVDDEVVLTDGSKTYKSADELIKGLKEDVDFDAEPPAEDPDSEGEPEPEDGGDEPPADSDAEPTADEVIEGKYAEKVEELNGIIAEYIDNFSVTAQYSEEPVDPEVLAFFSQAEYGDDVDLSPLSSLPEDATFFVRTVTTKDGESFKEYMVEDAEGKAYVIEQTADGYFGKVYNDVNEFFEFEKEDAKVYIESIESLSSSSDEDSEPVTEGEELADVVLPSVFENEFGKYGTVTPLEDGSIKFVCSKGYHTYVEGDEDKGYTLISFEDDKPESEPIESKFYETVSELIDDFAKNFEEEDEEGETKSEVEESKKLEEEERFDLLGLTYVVGEGNDKDGYMVSIYDEDGKVDYSPLPMSREEIDALKAEPEDDFIEPDFDEGEEE